MKYLGIEERKGKMNSCFVFCSCYLYGEAFFGVTQNILNKIIMTEADQVKSCDPKIEVLVGCTPRVKS